MSHTKRIAVPLIAALAMWFIASWMDVIPAEVAPVVRPDLQRYEQTLVSLQMLYGVGKISYGGVSCRSVDATPWAAFGVSAVALLAGGSVGYFLCRCTNRRSRHRRGPAKSTASSIIE